jgi:hypothetical protein
MDLDQSSETIIFDLILKASCFFEAAGAVVKIDSG